MPGSMLALRWHGRGDMRLERLATPVPDDHEALVRVHYTGLCGSDLEEYLDGPIVIDGPVVLGHEIVGVVAAAARDGSGPPAGTAVVVDVVTGCGHCYWCVRHIEGQCPELQVTGQHRDGGLAEYVVGAARRLIPVPEGLDLLHAALAEPVAVAVRGVRRLGNPLGRGAAIFGGGTIGLLTAQVLRHQGASPVILVEPDPVRRDVAAAVGVQSVWDTDEGMRRTLVGERFPEHGVDLVVECSGASGVAREAVRTVRAGGQVLLLSVTPDDQSLDTTDIVLGEKAVHGSAAHMWDEDVAPAVALLADGGVRVGPLLAPTVPLRQAADAFARMAAHTEGGVKVVVDCRDTGTPIHEEART